MTYRLGKTPTDLSSAVTSARAWISQLEAFRSGPATLVTSALQAFIASQEALTAAKGKASIIVTDPTRLAAWKVDQARALMTPAFQAVADAVEAIGATLDKAQAQLERGLLPPKPGAADSALLGFQAEQIAKTLEAAGDGAAVMKQAVQLLEDALASGDTVQAYLVAGGPMQLLYGRHGVIMAALAQQFAKALAAPAGQQSTDGAELLPLLTAGGSGTIRGLVVGARYAVTAEQNAYTSWLMQAVRTGQMAGINETAPSPQH